MQEREKQLLTDAVRETVKKRRLKYAFLDVDDTQIDTNTLYREAMRGFASYVAVESNKLNDNALSEEGEVTPDTVKKYMDTVLMGLKPELSAHPNIMAETARVTAKTYGLDFYSHPVREAVEELLSLYARSPLAFEGVHDALDILSGADLTPVAATLSNPERTDRNLSRNGLDHYFTGHVFNFPTWGVKGVGEWATIYEHPAIKAEKHEVLVCGDSWPFDIRPNFELGVPVENMFRVRSSFSHSNNGRIEGVKEIDRFAELPYLLVS